MTDSQNKWFVGQAVRVFRLNGSRYGQPRDGWPGVVKRVGRTLFDVAYAGESNVRTFKISDGHTDTDVTANRHWVLTLSEVAEQARSNAALDVIRKAKIDVYRAALSIEQLEAIAKIVAGVPAVQGEVWADEE